MRSVKREVLRARASRFNRFDAVLIVAVLYFAQTVIVPIALAVLMTFVLSLAVTPVQRKIGSVPSVLLVVFVTFATFGIAGWAITTQLQSLALELPGYQHNALQKVRDIRWLQKGGAMERVQQSVERLQAEIASGDPTGTSAKPVVVQAESVSSLWGLPVTPWLESLATVGLVMTLVIFMLLERQDLRNRLISLFGHGQLAITTRAFDEAGRRVSRYLFAQSLINLFFGVCVGIGLHLIGVPYAVLWAALAAVLRFVPYVGPWIAAAAPILVSLGAFDGWNRPLLVLGLFLALELFSNLVVETLFYAGAAGVSQVGLLVAFAFWTWLWGPLGLLMATPLTVCLVVMGKYVPGLDAISTLMSDEATLETDVSYYQRLLADDQAEAAEIVEQHLREKPPLSVYDAILIPALNYAERDRVEGRLTEDEERAIVESSRTILAEAQALVVDPVGPAAEERAATTRVVAWPMHGAPDEFALEMLRAILCDLPMTLDMLSNPGNIAEGLETIRRTGARVVCIADLPPSAPSTSRYLVKRLRAAIPGLTILVGRWATAPFADESVTALKEAGADAVATTLLETREQLERCVRPEEAAAQPTSPPLPSVAATVA
jgi:predicted PurR-regulated permease PerM